MTSEQGDQVIELLTHIAALMEMTLQPEPEDTGCPHPVENRISLSTPDDTNHWVCALCKFDNTAS